ncbi:hypothetical protein EB796_013543 [Bugula neritina]|uniref:Fucolectin tachylectin-4 pentraxin-1 domain-containing protein n=1 Tax=Bugula neritina TaxID=10212 RepID=A0A7J7JQC1_BUGNE|nr:hypothetical protein EB796_013543 [Bugula neritina]
MAVDHSAMWVKRLLLFRKELLVLWLLVSQALASLTPSNVALNKVTFSSGQHNKSSSPSVVVDGDKSYSFTIPSSGRFCTQCFLSTLSDNPWWRVDLGGQFFITNINIYTGSAYRNIGPFEILSKETSGNLNPADDYSQWNVIQSVSTLVSTYEYPLPTAVYAQHVAVMEKENPRQPQYQQVLLLTEVEVYGFSE